MKALITGTLNPHSNGPDHYTAICMVTGTLAVDGWAVCYIWYSEKGPGRAAARPSPLIAVPNVTYHPSTASVYHLHIIRCGTIITSALQRVKVIIVT